MDYKELPTGNLIKVFKELRDEYPDAELLKELISRPDAAIEIRKVLEDKDFWELEWGSSHFDTDSMYLLSAIRTGESFEGIKYMIKNHEDELRESEFITEELPSILANFGSLYFDKIVSIVKDKDNDEHVKFAAFRALSVIVLLNSELKRKLIIVSMELLDMRLIGEFPIYCLHDMADLKDERLFEKVLEFYERNNVGSDSHHPKNEQLKQTYNGILNFPICRTDLRYPLGYFDPKNFYSSMRYWDMYHPMDEEHDEDNDKDEVDDEDTIREMNWNNKTYWVDKGKKIEVGRNDPCPCGSGQKYKKCHGKST